MRLLAVLRALDAQGRPLWPSIERGGMAWHPEEAARGAYLEGRYSRASVSPSVVAQHHLGPDAELVDSSPIGGVASTFWATADRQRGVLVYPEGTRWLTAVFRAARPSHG